MSSGGSRPLSWVGGVSAVLMGRLRGMLMRENQCRTEAALMWLEEGICLEVENIQAWSLSALASQKVAFHLGNR